MSDTEFLTIDESRFVHQTVEDEVLVIDIVDGTYYCLRGSVAPLWPAIADGTTRIALIEAAAALFSSADVAVVASINAFLDRLRAEGILHPVAQTAGTAALPANAVKRDFVPLTVERYEEMRDLLTLDPVHDVTDSGWPHLPR